jgi:hypothetical protein
MKGKRLFAAVAFALSASPAAAESDGQLWTALFANGPVSDDGRFLLWFDGHARFRDDAGDLGVTILRPGVGWKVSDDLSLWAGYARVVARRENAPDIEENRLWQQATYPVAELFGGRITGRTRLEQRNVNIGDDTGHRVRQFLRYDRRFEGSALSAIMWNETFFGLNATDWGALSGYDQSRSFVGVGIHPNKRLRFEGGYMFNHIRRAGADDANNHTALFAIALAL